MLRIRADHANHAFAVHKFALGAHHFYGRSNFHRFLFTTKLVYCSNSKIRPRVLSRSDKTTRTRSPGRNLTKFRSGAPAAWARIMPSSPELTFTNFSLTPALG